MDVLLGLPIGLNAIALLAVQWLVRRQRLFLMGQSFIGLWLGFMVAVSAAVFFKWFVMSLLELTILPAGPALSSILTSIFLFPLISLFLLGVHKILPVTD